MFSITSIETIDYFEQEPRVISIFLATRFNMATVRWIFDSWLDLHLTTGHYWHLLVPTFDPIDDDLSKATDKNFNSALSRALIDQYGIDLRYTPCILFDDLNEEKRQPFISIFDHSDNELRDFFLDCAEIIKKNVPRAHQMSPAQWRTNVVGEIYNRSQLKKYGKGFLKIAPFIGKILKFGTFHSPH